MRGATPVYSLSLQRMQIGDNIHRIIIIIHTILEAPAGTPSTFQENNLSNACSINYQTGIGVYIGELEMLH